MHRLLLATVVTLLVAVSGFAQSSDDFHRWELFVGYSQFHQLSVPVSILERTADGHVGYKGSKEANIGSRGFEVSATSNLQRYFGLKVDFSRFSDTQHSLLEVRPATVEDVAFSSSSYKFFGGVQLKDNSKTKRVKPMVHLLVGNTLTRSDVPMREQSMINPNAFNTFIGQTSSTRYSAMVGGGLDLRMTAKYDLRAIQFDYNQANSGRDKSIRIGVGLVIH